MSLFVKDAMPELRIELFPDAWKRFHGAVHMMTKAGPQHRPAIEKRSDAGKTSRRRAKKLFTRQ